MSNKYFSKFRIAVHCLQGNYNGIFATHQHVLLDPALRLFPDTHPEPHLKRTRLMKMLVAPSDDAADSFLRDTGEPRFISAFKMAPGQDTQSLALQVAYSQGMNIDVLKRAMYWRDRLLSLASNPPLPGTPAPKGSTATSIPEDRQTTLQAQPAALFRNVSDTSGADGVTSVVEHGASNIDGSMRAEYRSEQAVNSSRLEASKQGQPGSPPLDPDVVDGLGKDVPDFIRNITRPRRAVFPNPKPMLSSSEQQRLPLRIHPATRTNAVAPDSTPSNRNSDATTSVNVMPDRSLASAIHKTGDGNGAASVMVGGKSLVNQLAPTSESRSQEMAQFVPSTSRNMPVPAKRSSVASQKPPLTGVMPEKPLTRRHTVVPSPRRAEIQEQRGGIPSTGYRSSLQADEITPSGKSNTRKLHHDASAYTTSPTFHMTGADDTISTYTSTPAADVDVLSVRTSILTPGECVDDESPVSRVSQNETNDGVSQLLISTPATLTDEAASRDSYQQETCVVTSPPDSRSWSLAWGNSDLNGHRFLGPDQSFPPSAESDVSTQVESLAAVSARVTEFLASAIASESVANAQTIQTAAELLARSEQGSVPATSSTNSEAHELIMNMPSCATATEGLPADPAPDTSASSTKTEPLQRDVKEEPASALVASHGPPAAAETSVLHGHVEELTTSQPASDGTLSLQGGVSKAKPRGAMRRTWTLDDAAQVLHAELSRAIAANASSNASAPASESVMTLPKLTIMDVQAGFGAPPASQRCSTVYVLEVESGEPSDPSCAFYVGETDNFKDRLKSHLRKYNKPRSTPPTVLSRAAFVLLNDQEKHLGKSLARKVETATIHALLMLVRASL